MQECSVGSVLHIRACACFCADTGSLLLFWAACELTCHRRLQAEEQPPAGPETGRCSSCMIRHDSSHRLSALPMDLLILVFAVSTRIYGKCSDFVPNVNSLCQPHRLDIRPGQWAAVESRVIQGGSGKDKWWRRFNVNGGTHCKDWSLVKMLAGSLSSRTSIRGL